MIRQVALLLFGLAVASALPQPAEDRFDWPDRPAWWPESVPWPPQRPDVEWPPVRPERDAAQPLAEDRFEWPNRPSWWPESRPWPPQQPDVEWPEWLPRPEGARSEEMINWPEQPSWWPDSYPWPPQRPDAPAIPDRPDWWPEQLPWPRVSTADEKINWPAQPSWWPASFPWPPKHPAIIPWPPVIPERPDWWPAQLPWPRSSDFAEELLNRPSWWPASLPWPPQRPDITWPPQKPSWWPENRPWPPQRPDITWPPQKPSWWPENRPWPPQRPDSISSPPESSDAKDLADGRSWLPWPPTHPEWIPWPPTHPDWSPWPPVHPEWIPWPPAHPEEWPERPAFWPPSWAWPPTEHPENIPWPPIFPENWERPSFWPDHWEWPPTQHPDSIPWPLPENDEDWPERPPLWPASWPWPPTSHPESIPWPPPQVINPDNAPYNPARDNEMHLFTRLNPSVSQPLVIRNENLLRFSNFNPHHKTVVLIHDRHQSAISQLNVILVPALLQADNVNVIVVDWSRGAGFHAAISSFAAIASSNFVAVFLSWVQHVTETDWSNFKVIGLGVGAHSASIIGRRLEGNIGSILLLDPAKGPSLTELLPPINLRAGKFTEVIHTDAGGSGYIQPLGDVDFYPNGGSNMPGCGGDRACNRFRAVHFYAESLGNGNFVGVQCENFRQAREGACDGEGRLNFGGLEPKIGASGVYHLTTNAFPPFAQN